MTQVTARESLQRHHRIATVSLLAGLTLLSALSLAQSADAGARAQPGASDTTASTPSGAHNASPVQGGRVLFLGNSITLHAPSAAIDWTGNWGMAASSQEKDFVHIMARRLSDATGHAPDLMIANIAEFERNCDAYDVDTKLTNQLAFRADTVIVGVGENVPALDSEEAKVKFRTGLLRLLRRLKTESSPTIVVRSCFWPVGAKDLVLKQACEEVGGIFVDISRLGKDESNYARSERKFKHNGVGAHPGDRGMQAIADAIADAIKKHRLSRSE